MGGVNNTDHYASEAFLPMSFPAKSFQKEHVPFVDPTAALSTRTLDGRGHRQPLGDLSGDDVPQIAPWTVGASPLRLRRRADSWRFSKPPARLKGPPARPQLRCCR